MVKVSEIKDRDSLEAWLLDRPEDETKTFALIIVHRAAMRALPYYWEWVGNPSSVNERHLTVLSVLQSNLVSGVARFKANSDIKEAAEYAIHAANIGSSNGLLDAVTYLAYASGKAAADNAGSAFTVNAIDLVGTEFISAAGVLWENIRYDCEAIQNGDILLTAPLWNGDENPFQKEWDVVRQSLPAATSAQSEETARGAVPVDWSFWINWYQDALEGREPDWDMLAEIALILDEDWKKGPEHINNEVIARIVEKYRLLHDVQALRKELAEVRQTATAAPMGHNNPPEGIEAEAEVVTQTEIIWAALEEAEEELSKPEPSPSVLKRVGVAILGAIAEVGKYGAKLGDVALKAVAGTVGAGVGAYLIGKGPVIQSVAERILSYVEAYLR